jgi:hypothetical protein
VSLDERLQREREAGRSFGDLATKFDLLINLVTKQSISTFCP